MTTHGRRLGQQKTLDDWTERFQRLALRFCSGATGYKLLQRELRAYRKALLLDLAERYQESQTVPGGIHGWLERLAGD